MSKPKPRIGIVVRRVYQFNDGIEECEPGRATGPDGEPSWYAVYFREQHKGFAPTVHYVDFDTTDNRADVRLLAEALSKHLGLPVEYAFERKAPGPIKADGTCAQCGRDYEGELAKGADCPSDDCPSNSK